MLDPKEETFLKTSKQSVQKHLKHSASLGSVIIICIYVYVYSSETWLHILCVLTGCVCSIFFTFGLFVMILELNSIRWLKLKSRANELSLPFDIDEIEKFINRKEGD